MTEEGAPSRLLQLQRAIAKASTARLPSEGDFYVSIRLTLYFWIAAIDVTPQGSFTRICEALRANRLRRYTSRFESISFDSAVLQQLQELQGAGAGMPEEHHIHTAEATGVPCKLVVTSHLETFYNPKAHS